MSYNCLLIIFVSVTLSCCTDSDFNSRARNFSVKLIKYTGLDHGIIGSYGIWSLMATAAIWARSESPIQLSKYFVTANKSSFIEDYLKLRNAVLDFDSNKNHIQLENFVFMNKDFNLLPEFKETLTTHFKIHINSFDFGNSITAANDANQIVRLATPTSVRLHLEPNDFINITMIMANAMVFKGTWTSTFEESLTTTIHVGKHRKSVMHQHTKIPFTNIEQIKANVMELAFGNDGKYSMIIIQPHSEVAITETYKKLEEFTLVDIIDKLQEDVKEFGLKNTNLTLPKFRTQTVVELNKSLKDMGIVDVFEPDDGHFPGISGDDIFISSVSHKAVMSLDEVGVNVFTSTPGHNFITTPLDCATSNEPFIFFVLENHTKTVLFNGLYSKLFCI